EVQRVAEETKRVAEMSRFLRAHPRRGLVEEQEIGIGGQGHGQVAKLLRAVGELGHHLPGYVLEAQELQDLLGVTPEGPLLGVAGLARAVRSDEPDDLPLADVEVESLQGLEAPEPDRDVPRFQDLRHEPFSLRLRKPNKLRRRVAGGAASSPSPAETGASSEVD